MSTVVNISVRKTKTPVITVMFIQYFMTGTQFSKSISLRGSLIGKCLHTLALLKGVTHSVLICPSLSNLNMWYATYCCVQYNNPNVTKRPPLISMFSRQVRNDLESGVERLRMIKTMILTNSRHTWLRQQPLQPRCSGRQWSRCPGSSPCPGLWAELPSPAPAAHSPLHLSGPLPSDDSQRWSKGTREGWKSERRGQKHKAFQVAPSAPHCSTDSFVPHFSLPSLWLSLLRLYWRACL